MDRPTAGRTSICVKRVFLLINAGQAENIQCARRWLITEKREKLNRARRDKSSEFVGREFVIGRI